MTITFCVAITRTRCSCWTQPSAFPSWISNVINFSKSFTYEIITYHSDFFFFGTTAPWGQSSPHFRGSTITLRHSRLIRTLLDEWWTRLREVYMKTQNTHDRRIVPAGLEPEMPVSERPQTHALDPAATGIVHHIYQENLKLFLRAWKLCLVAVVFWGERK